MSAKRAAKNERKMREQAKAAIGAGYARNPKEQAQLTRTRRINRLAMQRGEPLDIDRRFTLAISDHIRFDELAAANSFENINYFEQSIRLAMVICGIYDDNALHRAVRAAETALANSLNAPAKTRRETLHPLADLLGYMLHYRETAPANTFAMCAIYCEAVQTLLYGAEYVALPEWQQDALYRIIRGQSLRSLAQEAKSLGNPITEPALREKILEAAEMLYKAVEPVCDLPVPDSLPILRAEAWQPFGNPENLASIIRRAIPISNEFELNVGIGLIDYNGIREIAIQTQLQQSNQQNNRNK